MALTPAQIKGRLKNIAKENRADARILIRLFMMERFLERVSNSQYAEKFIIKGGILVTSMVGVALRSTMDIDASIRNQNLSEDDALHMVEEISAIDLNDGIMFEVKAVENIMDDMEYPGIRLSLNAIMDRMITPIKIDISTGDIITPRAIEYHYRLMLEGRTIKLWSYNLETILAEKLETVFTRGLLNTRMRDFYDIHTLLQYQGEGLDVFLLRKAFDATCQKRNRKYILDKAEVIINSISDDENLQNLWKAYQRKYIYASDIMFSDTIESIHTLLNMITRE